MPRESQELMIGNENLLQICLDLHMAHTGSSDPLLDYVKERYLKILHLANLHWRPSVRHKEFDNAVRTLILATMRECASED